MKKYLTMFLLMVLTLFASCTSNDIEPINKQKIAKTTVLFNINTEGSTRSASIGDNWPNADTKTAAETIVENVYSTPKDAGLSFFTSNYNVKLTSDKGSDITSWNGSTTLSLTDVNTLSVTLTEKTVGAYPKFKTANGTIDISNVDLDTTTPDKSKAVCTGDIEVNSISVSSDGIVNVTIVVNLSYDSYLLVAPSSNWSILSTIKGFTTLKWGGSNGTAFFTSKYNTIDWYYYWGTGDEYVYGKGTLLSYGFNLYSTKSTNIHVENGKWYALFAAWSSAGEGDDDSTNTDDTSKTHTVGGTSGIEPTSEDIVAGGVIR